MTSSSVVNGEVGEYRAGRPEYADFNVTSGSERDPAL